MARKRNRTEDAQTLPQTKKIRGKNVAPKSKTDAKSSKSSAKRPVQLTDLKWTAVEVPDQLDDYEGFYGLEEVDDVEVIRENGKIAFKASSSLLSDQTKGPGDDNVTANAADESDEEWAGFSDEEEEEEEEETQSQGTSETTLATNGKKSPPTSSFHALGEEDLDSGIDMSEWKPLELSPEVLGSLAKLKFARPTPIQTAAIPEILSGHDVIGKASTGSGKTLAFGIPILELFLQLSSESKTSTDQGSGKALALVISPTRELAHQISSHITALCSDLSVRSPLIATITGGLSLQKQERLLSRADVVIGTPGRLWEVMSSAGSARGRLKGIRLLVLDEADRLLSDGHFKELEEILNTLNRKDDIAEAEKEESEASDNDRQTLIFSATFHKGLQMRLTSRKRPNGDLMNQKESLEYLLSKVKFREEAPKFIDVDPVQQLASGLQEGIVECAGTEKDLYLYTLLLQQPKSRTLVFANSIAAVRRLAPFLQNLNLSVQSLHSGMEQKARLRAIERFTAAKSSILIATDVAARGLDIQGVQLVIHYHLPRTADMYVHRSGRTARAENKGASIIICSPDEVGGLRRLVARVHTDNAPSASKYSIQSIEVDRRMVSRLKPRANLAKKIADVSLAKEKSRANDAWLREAAEELGVDYDSEEMEATGKGKHGRGSGRQKKERENRQVTKGELGAWKAELKSLLSQRVNLGISERYLASGVVDIDALLRGDEGEFLGAVKPLELETA